MSSEEIKEPLLSCSNDIGNNDADTREPTGANAESGRRIRAISGQPGYKSTGKFTLSLIFLSMLGNAILLYKYNNLKNAPDLGRSSFSKYYSTASAPTITQ